MTHTVTEGPDLSERDDNREARCGAEVFDARSVVLHVAVSHADALQAVARLHGRRGFLHRQPVVHRLVALAVQRDVQDALQPEVTVGLLLMGGEGRRKKQKGEGGGGGRERERNTEHLRNVSDCRPDKSG